MRQTTWRVQMKGMYFLGRSRIVTLLCSNIYLTTTEELITRSNYQSSVSGPRCAESADRPLEFNMTIHSSISAAALALECSFPMSRRMISVPPFRRGPTAAPKTSGLTPFDRNSTLQSYYITEARVPCHLSTKLPCVIVQDRLSLYGASTIYQAINTIRSLSQLQVAVAPTIWGLVSMTQPQLRDQKAVYQNGYLSSRCHGFRARPSTAIR